MGMKVTAVEPGSLADELGFGVGDELLEVNGHRLRDILDYRFRTGGESELEIYVRDAGGETTLYEVEKEPDEPLGLQFEEFRYTSCGDNCVFCFVDQNPAGLRKPIYFRDGDFRLSFLYGNYNTLTNVGPKSLERIVEQRLSPMYISVHSTIPEVRMKLMRHKKDDGIAAKMQYLADHGIDMHTQIVLVPDWNDGESLIKTIDDLWAMRGRVKSCSVVPLGITDLREGLTKLRHHTSEEANAIIDWVERKQAEFRPVFRKSFLYVSDEMYLRAGRELPLAAIYDGFPQLENGVGLVRHFLDDFAEQAESLPGALDKPRKLTFVTGTLASPVIARAAERLNAIDGLSVELVTAVNTLFGPSVTVAGLLSAACILSALEGHELGDLVVLPPDCVNYDGRFLDELTLPEMEAKLGRPCVLFDGDWDKLVAGTLDLARPIWLNDLVLA